VVLWGRGVKGCFKTKSRLVKAQAVRVDDRDPEPPETPTAGM